VTVRALRDSARRRVAGFTFRPISQKSVVLSVYGTFLALIVLLAAASSVTSSRDLSEVFQNTLRDVASTTRV
jgi:hypothetical protein